MMTDAAISEVSEGQGRLDEYLSMIGNVLGHKKRRECFATYAMGLLGEGARKSVEPIACRACADPEKADAAHQRLLHFVGQSEWSDREVRRAATRYAVDVMAACEPVRAWIFDDTGFLKQGKHSVGVQRQYTGSAGKITNCQIGVSLTLATASAHVPVDFELYLPEQWVEDAALREQAGIPDEVTFKTKIELALGMFARAVEDKVPGDLVLADSFYGDAIEFRDTVRVHGFDYAVGVASSTLVRCGDGRGFRSEPESARDIARRLGPGAFRKVTWREGTKATLASHFAFRRVRIAGKTSFDESVWLVVEWPAGESEPTRYHLTTLGTRMTKREIVRLLKERYRTEVAYHELKDGLGLDHFEGRSFRGWHHHVSVALCCYAFVVAERLRHFPPSRSRPSASRAHPRAA